MMRKILVVFFATIVFAMNGKAQGNRDRLSLGVGCLYQNGLDLTLSYDLNAEQVADLNMAISFPKPSLRSPWPETTFT